jgi:alkaline phosphatase D
MRHNTILIIDALIVACVGAGCARPLAGRTLVAHDFSTSAQGWLVAGDTGTVEPTFEPRGGHPGGHISNEDEAVGETWYFRAPPSVLAQLPAAEGGLLTYSLRQSSTDAGFPDDDVVIVGRAGRLSYRFGRSPGTEWSAFSVPLSEAAGWRWNWSQPATQEQIRRVLAQPVSLEIRGEYRTGDDVGGLDTVTLTARF